MKSRKIQKIPDFVVDRDGNFIEDDDLDHVVKKYSQHYNEQTSKPVAKSNITTNLYFLDQGQ